MTSISTTRPPIAAPRAGAQAGPAGGHSTGMVAVDPVKILKQYKWPLIIAILIGAVLGVGAYFLLRFLAPSYQSRIIYQVSPPITKVTDDQANFSDREEFERFMSTQTQMMTEERILRDALTRNQRLREDTIWIKQFIAQGQPDISEALKELKKIVSARVRTGTALIQLSVVAPNPTDSAIIANAVDWSYMSDLRDVTMTNSSARRGPLSRTKQDLQQQIDQIDGEMRRIMVSNKIERIDESPGQRPEEVEIINLQPRRVEAMEKAEQAKNRLDVLTASIGQEGQPIQFLDDQREAAEREPLVVQQRQRAAEYKTLAASSLEKGQGPQHPEQKRLRSLAESAEQEYQRTRNDTLRKIFDADVENTRRSLSDSQRVLTELDKKLEQAKERASTITQALVELRLKKENRLILIAQKQKIDEVLDEIRMIDELQKTDAQGGYERIGRMRRLQPATTPDTLYFPRLETMIPLGIVAVLGLTLTVIVLRELLDQRVRGPSDIGYIARLRLLGMVPLASEDPTRPAQVETAFRDSPTGAVSEGFRQIRSPLLKKMQQSGYKSLLIMGGAPGAGATTTVANLALGFAASDMRVLMIDANFRRPALHRIFKLAEGPGLGDVLNRKTALDQAVQQTSTPNLHLLSAGAAANRAVPEKLATEAMTQTLVDAREKYDIILIDTAPALVAGDGVAIANRCDASMLVIKTFSEKRGLVARVRDQLGDTRSEFFGVVINAVRSAAGGYMRRNIKTAYEYQTTPTGV